MADYEIKIKTTADLKAAQDLEASLQKNIAVTKTLGGDSRQLETELKKVQTAMKSSQGGESGLKKASTETRGLLNQVPGLEKFGGVLSSLAVGPAKLLAVGIAGVTSALVVAKQAVTEFAESQERIASLDQTIANQGALTDAYRKKLQGLAGDLQDATSIADDQWLAVLERLSKFGASPENIDQYAEAVKNLAGIIGGEVPQAAEIFSKALAGNFGELRRYGIQVDENASQSQKLQQVMEQLADRGAGILEAKSKTLNGQFRSLKNAASDLWEAVGNLISRTGLLQAALSLATEALKKLTNFLPTFQAKLDGINNRIPPLNRSLGYATAALNKTGDAARAAGESAEGFSQGGLAQIKTAAEQAATALEKTVNAAQKLKSEADQLDDAETAVRLAQIDEAEASGRISPLDAKQRRLNEKRGLAIRRANRDRQAREAEADFIAGMEGQAALDADVTGSQARETEQARRAALEQLKTAGAKSDQEIELKRVNAELAKTTGRGRTPAVQGEKRRLLEENRKNLQEHIEAGALTFTTAEALAKGELDEAQERFNRTARGPSRGRVTAERRAQNMAEAQARLGQAQSNVQAFGQFSDLDKRLAEEARAAADARRKKEEVEAALGPRKAELETRRKVQEFREAEMDIQGRTETIRLRNEAQQQQERPESRRGNAPQGTARIDTRQAEQAVQQAGQEATSAVDSVLRKSTGASQALAQVARYHESQIAQLTNEVKMLRGQLYNSRTR